MLIAGYVIDPMYILIPLFLVMILLMIGLALVMLKMVNILNGSLKFLKGIHEENLYTNRLAHASDISEQQTSKSASIVYPGSTS